MATDPSSPGAPCPPISTTTWPGATWTAAPSPPAASPPSGAWPCAPRTTPLDYADFEGTIPEDEYGGGSVIVWDAGTFDNQREDPLPGCLEDGKLEVSLDGEKLRGGYVLVRTDSDGDQERWLLIKRDDDGADARRRPTSTEPESVRSSQTVEEVGQ